MTEEIESAIFEEVEKSIQSGVVEPTLDYSVKQLDGLGSVTEKKLMAFGVSTLYDFCLLYTSDAADE